MAANVTTSYYQLAFVFLAIMQYCSLVQVIGLCDKMTSPLFRHSTCCPNSHASNHGYISSKVIWDNARHQTHYSGLYNAVRLGTRLFFTDIWHSVYRLLVVCHTRFSVCLIDKLLFVPVWVGQTEDANSNLCLGGHGPRSSVLGWHEQRMRTCCYKIRASRKKKKKKNLQLRIRAFVVTYGPVKWNSAHLRPSAASVSTSPLPIFSSRFFFFPLSPR